MVFEITDPWTQLQECSYPPTNRIKYIRSILGDAFWQRCVLLHGECQTSDCHGNSRVYSTCSPQDDTADWLGRSEFFKKKIIQNDLLLRAHE